jgi:hypothetical protein
MSALSDRNRLTTSMMLSSGQIIGAGPKDGEFFLNDSSGALSSSATGQAAGTPSSKKKGTGKLSRHNLSTLRTSHSTSGRHRENTKRSRKTFSSTLMAFLGSGHISKRNEGRNLVGRMRATARFRGRRPSGLEGQRQRHVVKYNNDLQSVMQAIDNMEQPLLSQVNASGC